MPVAAAAAAGMAASAGTPEWWVWWEDGVSVVGGRSGKGGGGGVQGHLHGGDDDGGVTFLGDGVSVRAGGKTPAALSGWPHRRACKHRASQYCSGLHWCLSSELS